MYHRPSIAPTDVRKGEHVKLTLRLVVLPHAKMNNTSEAGLLPANIHEVTKKAKVQSTAVQGS
jgi:hypothetical protein